jgi:hypothetical protein
MLLAASPRNSTLSDLISMDPIEREFLSYWTREREYDQMQQLGRLMGVFFNAGEVRSWKADGGERASSLEDEDNLLIPLSFMIRPEGREAIQKMVGTGGLALPKGYRQAPGEVVVDLGKVSPEEFKSFVEKHRVSTLKG